MSIITDLQNLCGFAGAGGYGASAGERVSLRGGITAAAISRGNLLFCLQGQEDTLRRHYFDRSERCPKFLAFLETLAECKTYRGFAPASPNPAGSLSSTQSKRKSTPYGVLFLFGRGRRIRCALDLCRRLRAVSGKIFVLPTSQFQNAIAHFGLFRRTLRVRKSTCL